MGFLVDETFHIEGRGEVVLFSDRAGLPAGYALHARIRLPDGSMFEAQAFREFLRRTEPHVHEREAFLLKGLARDSVPVGSSIEFDPVPAGGPES